MSGSESQRPHSRVGAESAREDSTHGLIKRRSTRTFLDFYHQKQALCLCCLLILATLVVFAPSLRNDFVNYDDPEYVTANSHVQKGLTLENLHWALVTTEASNWHPLTWLSHMLDCQLFGLKSWGHHLTSVILHALNTGLLFLVLRGMTGALWRSLFVACLFGFHPLRVQSVAWIAERKDVLSALFWMLTLWAYGCYAKKSKTRNEQTFSRFTHSRLSHAFWYSLALGFFACGLMSKPMVVTLPFVLLLLDYWPLNRMNFSRGMALVWEKIPFFALAGAASTMTFLVQKDAGALRRLAGLSSLMARVDNALISYCRYLGKIFYPIKLAAFYPYPGAWPALEVIFAAGLLLGISVAVLAFGRRRPYLVVGWFWYLGTLVPAIGLVQVGAQSIADRYTYIPLIGVFLLLVWSAHDLTGQWRYQGPRLVAVALVIVFLCVMITRWQIGFWADSETLFRRSLAVTGDNALARLNLGVALGEKGRPEALGELNAALRFFPDDPDLQFTVGNAMMAVGYPREAIAPLQKSLAINPAQAQCHLILGRALEKTSLLDEAVFHYRETIRLKPELVDAHNDLGLALCNQTQFGQAIEQFKQALRLDPTSAKTHDFLGFALTQAGQTDEAISQFREAIRIKPDFAESYSRLGVVFLTGGRLEEAIQQFQRAIALKPNYTDAYINLGVALSNKGDLDGAANQYRQALAIEPNHAIAQKNLDLILSRKRGSVSP